MLWFLSRRKSRKAAKLKEGRAATAPVAKQTTRERIGRPSRRRRLSLRSVASMRDVEQDPPVIHPADAASRTEAGMPPSVSIEDITALPVQYRLAHSPHLRPVTQEHGIAYNFQSQSHSSLPAVAKERGKLQRPQSLRPSPPSDSIIRRKSSKRRQEEHLREEEIRAMSRPMPQKRPAGNSSSMLRRDSKKVKGALNHRFERPTSNISLPLEDSIHSSMSGSSDLRSFRVSALDMFSPRPTIRCSVGSQYYAGERASPTARPPRTDSQREQRPTSSQDEDRYKRTSRIDDLADALDAGALRDILERDKRRRDKKARAEQDRLRRRLERRAEKQKAAEVGGTPGTPRKEAVGAVGLGIRQTPSTPMEDVRPSTPQRSQRLETVPVTPKTQEPTQLPTPMDSPVEEPVVSDARAVRYSRGSVSAPAHGRGHSNVSQLPELISERLAKEQPASSVEHLDDPFRDGSLHAV